MNISNWFLENIIKKIVVISIISGVLSLSIPVRSQPVKEAHSSFRYDYLFSFQTKKDEDEKTYGNPRTLAVNSAENIYVVVPNAREIWVYNPKGSFLFSFGMKINDQEKVGRFSEPSGITIDDKDLVYVSDLDRDMVLIFSPEGEFRDEFPIFQPKGKTDACAPFISFNALKKLLYIPDPCTQKVNIYTNSGEFITSFGEMGLELGKFGGLANCTFNKNGELYIIDPGNFRVQFFSSNHQPINSFGVKGIKGGEFIRPYDIGIDSAERIFVSDFIQKSIHVFDSNGVFLSLIKEKDFIEPLGIAFSPENRLYIVDGEGQKIHVIQVD
ncbi:MAG: NHL repeat-containing protein [bacterium]